MDSEVNHYAHWHYTGIQLPHMGHHTGKIIRWNRRQNQVDDTYLTTFLYK